MIGQIRKVLTPFYDRKTGRMEIKSRPGLVIAAADSDDYVILPVSKVSDQRRIDPEYDIKVDPSDFPNLSLNCVSYIRTHKQTVVHRASMGDMISNLKQHYEELYLTVLEKREQFSEEITRQAMEE